MLYLNDIPVDVTKFPDGTSQVWQLKLDGLNQYPIQEIKWEFQTEGEVFHLMQLVDLLRTSGLKKLTLEMPYLPYARQDKDLNNNECFALITFANIINSLDFEQVYVLDAHSPKAHQFINDLVVRYPKRQVIEMFGGAGDYDLVVYPDLGAKEKYSELYDLPYIYATKTRNPSNGHLTFGEIYTSENNLVFSQLEDKNVLIVDDICDGGGTFIQLADRMKDFGVGDIGLFVSHGLFTKGVAPLLNSGIKDIRWSHSTTQNK